MERSWKNVKRNKGSPGIDRITVKTYHKYIESNLDELMKALKTRGAYKCPPLKRVYIPKGNTERTSSSRHTYSSHKCAQEVIRRLIAPIFETQFHDNSFGFRPGRNCHQAVERVLEYTKQGYKYVVDIDIKGFFDNIPHEIILTMLRAEIADGNILDIIESFLRSGVVEKGRLIPTLKRSSAGRTNFTANWKHRSQLPRLATRPEGISFRKICRWYRHTLQTHRRGEKRSDFNYRDTNRSWTRTKSREDENFFPIWRISISWDLNHVKGYTIRQKSKDKFEDKIKEITKRSHNLDAKVFQKIQSNNTWHSKLLPHKILKCTRIFLNDR